MRNFQAMLQATSTHFRLLSTKKTEFACLLCRRESFHLTHAEKFLNHLVEAHSYRPIEQDEQFERFTSTDKESQTETPERETEQVKREPNEVAAQTEETETPSSDVERQMIKQELPSESDSAGLIAMKKYHSQISQPRPKPPPVKTVSIDLTEDDEETENMPEDGHSPGRNLVPKVLGVSDMPVWWGSGFQISQNYRFGLILVRLKTQFSWFGLVRHEPPSRFCRFGSTKGSISGSVRLGSWLVQILNPEQKHIHNAVKQNKDIFE